VPATRKKSFLAPLSASNSKKSFFTTAQYPEKQSKTTTTQIDNENFIFFV